MRCKVDKNSTGKPFRNAQGRFAFDVLDARYRRTGARDGLRSGV